MKVSVIVAVYKAEDYLARCVNSILNQTLADFELILVDDGSPDNSGVLCDQFAKEDGRIVVIHNEHQGVSKTRQTGLECARGEYVLHVDPDDWLEPWALQILCEKADVESADMVLFDMWSDYSSSSWLYWVGIHSDLSRENLICEILDDRVCGGSCNKLLRTELFAKFGVKFPSGVNYLEHTCVICQLLLQPIKLVYLRSPLYHYDRYVNKNSIVRIQTDTHLESIKSVVDILKCPLIEKGLEDALCSLKARAKDAAFMTTGMTGKEYRNLYKEINPRFVKSRWKRGNGFRFKISALTVFPLFWPLRALAFRIKKVKTQRV